MKWFSGIILASTFSTIAFAQVQSYCAGALGVPDTCVPSCNSICMHAECTPVSQDGGVPINSLPFSWQAVTPDCSPIASHGTYTISSVDVGSPGQTWSDGSYTTAHSLPMRLYLGHNSNNIADTIAGATRVCTTQPTSGGPCPIDGVCGPDQGAVSSTPTNLCSAGSASSFSGGGPWTWTCNGQFGGNPASCGAALSTPGNCQCVGQVSDGAATWNYTNGDTDQVTCEQDGIMAGNASGCHWAGPAATAGSCSCQNINHFFGNSDVCGGTGPDGPPYEPVPAPTTAAECAAFNTPGDCDAGANHQTDAVSCNWSAGGGGGSPTCNYTLNTLVVIHSPNSWWTSSNPAWPGTYNSNATGPNRPGAIWFPNLPLVTKVRYKIDGADSAVVYTVAVKTGSGSKILVGSAGGNESPGCSNFRPNPGYVSNWNIVGDSVAKVEASYKSNNGNGDTIMTIEAETVDANGCPPSSDDYGTPARQTCADGNGNSGFYLDFGGF